VRKEDFISYKNLPPKQPTIFEKRSPPVVQVDDKLVDQTQGSVNLLKNKGHVLGTQMNSDQRFLGPETAPSE